MLADADALVERVRCGVVLDQGAAEHGERAVGRHGVPADRAAPGVRGKGVATGGGQPAGRGLADGHCRAVGGHGAVTRDVIGGRAALPGSQGGVGDQQVTGAVDVEPEGAAADRRRCGCRARLPVTADDEGVDGVRASLVDDEHAPVVGELDLPRHQRSRAEWLNRSPDGAQATVAEPEAGDRFRSSVERVDQVVS